MTPTLSSQIRRHLVAALSAAWLLIAALVAALALDAPLWVLIGVGLLVVGAAAGSFVLLRPVMRQLMALDGFERALVSASQSQEMRPLEPADKTPGDAQVLYEACNRLARRSGESSAKILKYLSHMYHEGNTLLASILGYGSMVADSDLRPDDANLEEYGQIIVDQARCAAALLEDFTMAARIDGGQFAPTRRPVRLGPLLRTLVDEIAEQSGREIVLSGTTENVVVRADALSLEKAVRKLVENALKFSPPECPARVTVELRAARRQVLIHVQDQGTGISAEERSGLFQPFTRGKQEAARRIPGNGLGLYIASAIVRAHQGEISVESQPGAGANFTITIPLEEPTG